MYGWNGPGWYQIIGRVLGFDGNWREGMALHFFHSQCEYEAATAVGDRLVRV